MGASLRIARAALAALALAFAAPALAEERILPVPATTIYPGDTIKATAIKERSFPAGYRSRLPLIDDRVLVVGKTARRTLHPGEPIPANAVEDTKLVSRGVPADVVFEENGLKITAIGTPLEHGSLGEIVRVRNIDTGRIVIGRVQADGKIRIGVQ